MRLKHLYIKDYKNLKDFSLDFENGNGLSILIGNNGSGKSNVLEAISGIFSEAYRDNIYQLKTDYSLEYEIDGKTFILKKQNDERKLILNETVLTKSEIIQNLPSNVIALYSGEDLRLWENFYLQRYLEYITSVYRRGFTGKMGMYYVNKFLWNIALFVMLLFKEDYSEFSDFLVDELGIVNFDEIKIQIDFDYSFYEKNRNQLLKAFIDKINPQKEDSLIYSISEWKSLISDSPLYFFAQSNEVFNNLMLAYMPKDMKLISDVFIFFEDRNIVESLSEGEKKLILIKAILEFIADEKALILFDEPDANIHEDRKRKLYELLKNFPNREVIMTTHSPIIAKIASENELVYLESKQGKVDIIETEKLDLIRKLASNEWNIMEAGVFLNSEKPLVLFEGKSDIDFVRRAIELLKDDNPKYAKIDVDFLSFNGTGNAAAFIEDVRNCVNDKKIILFFDRDDSGRNGMAEVFNKDKKSVEIKECHDFCTVDSLLKASFYPFSNEVNSGEFLIEDYFPERLIKEIINKLLEGKKHPIKEIPNLPKRIKDILANNYHNYPKTDYEGFKSLLDKLIELLGIE